MGPLKRSQLVAFPEQIQVRRVLLSWWRKFAKLGYYSLTYFSPGKTWASRHYIICVYYGIDFPMFALNITGSLSLHIWKYSCLIMSRSCLILQRPPSSSLSGYGLGNDEARSPSSGGGTPGLIHQPGSHISGDNISEAGKHHFLLPPYRVIKWRPHM